MQSDLMEMKTTLVNGYAKSPNVLVKSHNLRKQFQVPENIKQDITDVNMHYHSEEIERGVSKKATKQKIATRLEL